jgi:hypothetical protein
VGFIKELILRSKLSSNASGKKNFVSWDKIKTIALIVDHKSAANKNHLDKFIYETDKVVDVYFIDGHVKESAIKNFTTFIKADRSLFGLPNAKAIAKLKTQPYDLVINAAFNETDFSSIIANTLKTGCRSGFQSRLNELDLIIERKPNQELISYLGDVVTYVKMIRN